MYLSKIVRNWPFRRCKAHVNSQVLCRYSGNTFSLLLELIPKCLKIEAYILSRLMRVVLPNYKIVGIRGYNILLIYTSLDRSPGLKINKYVCAGIHSVPNMYLNDSVRNLYSTRS